MAETKPKADNLQSAAVLSNPHEGSSTLSILGMCAYSEELRDDIRCGASVLADYYARKIASAGNRHRQQQ